MERVTELCGSRCIFGVNPLFISAFAFATCRGGLTVWCRR